MSDDDRCVCVNNQQQTPHTPAQYNATQRTSPLSIQALEANKETHKETHTQRNKHTHTQRNKQTNKQTNKQRNKHTHKQTHKQTNTHTKKQTHKQTKDTQTNKHTHKQTNKHTNTQPTNQPTNKQPTIQPTNRPTNQPTNQPTKHQSPPPPPPNKRKPTHTEAGTYLPTSPLSIQDLEAKPPKTSPVMALTTSSVGSRFFALRKKVVSEAPSPVYVI